MPGFDREMNCGSERSISKTQIDFADYRPVAGVMMPFKRTYGWVSGREEYTLTEIKPNVQVDDAKFVKPPSPK